MQRFFTDNLDGEILMLDGEDGEHIAKSLRMKLGEKLCVCDGKMNECLCSIENIEKDKVTLKVLERKKNIAESDINLHLFQAVPKLNKLEFIIEKAVELGVKKITPILTRYCVAKITEKNLEKKLERFKKIAKGAAAQSQRGIIPDIMPVLNFKETIEEVKKNDVKILFYEYGKEGLHNIELEGKKEVGIIVGSEGGFSNEEVLYAQKEGVFIKSLGKRILRCETAPICAISVIMHITKNL